LKKGGVRTTRSYLGFLSRVGEGVHRFCGRYSLVVDNSQHRREGKEIEKVLAPTNQKTGIGGRHNDSNVKTSNVE